MLKIQNKMKKKVLLLLTFISSVAFGQIENGTYCGLIEMCYIDSTGIKHCYGDYSEGKEIWYHLSYLKIMNDSVYLDMYPVYLNEEEDTLYSSSDGGFYYYKGKIIYDNDSFCIYLKNINCDYCINRYISELGDTIIVNHDEKFNGKIMNENFLINESLFKKSHHDFFVESDYFKRDK
jgi:hypothetical protein